MPQFNASNAECHVFTEKEGLLSAVAHDLELAVTQFSVSADDQSIDAKFDASSLRVLHAMRGGRPTAALSDKDKRDIEGNLLKDVLVAAKFPEIRFVSTSVTKAPGGATIAGDLTLHGATRPIQLVARLEGNKYVGEIVLNQPDFGIKPFSAMMGTLKVKARLKVRMTLPAW